jgi:GABA permease
VRIVRRYLVVASQTLCGDQLLEQPRERMEAGPAHFHVLVPATPLDQLEPHLGYQDPTKGGPKDSAEELGWAAARQRLHQELLRLRRLGAQVGGEVGEADPVAAIKEVLGGQPVDEIILSTLPQRRSRWLARDLPGRVQRDFGLPVTHVVAESGAPV